MSDIKEFSQFTTADIEAARQIICKDAPDEIIRLILHRCAQLGCDPLARMIYAVKRKGVWTLQASIDLFRATAESGAGYAGQDGPYWCGSDGVWKDVWLDKAHPAAAKVGIYRTGFAAPLISIATWDSYAQTGDQGFMWTKFGSLMLAKCAESLAIRRAFPTKLSGIYTQDEMGQAENMKAVSSAPLPVALPTATMAPGADIFETTPSEVIALYVAGKAVGKLQGAVNQDLQRLGGDVLALKAEYENALSQKNPRGGNGALTHEVAGPVTQRDSERISEPAVDGEAGTYTLNRTPKPPQPSIGLEIADDLIPEAPASEKTQAVMAVMTHAGFEKALPEYSQKMAFCSNVTGRAITAWSQLTPGDCANVLARLNTEYKVEPSGELATDSEIVQLQIHLKDADFIAMLKKSRTYREAQEADQTQADSLRAARLAYAGSILKHPVASFKELTSAELQTLFAALKGAKVST